MGKYSFVTYNRSALLFCLFLSFFSPCRIGAQSDSSLNRAKDPSQLIVHSVNVIGRWVSDDLRQKIQRILPSGHTLTSQMIGNAMQTVSEDISNLETRFPVQVINSTSVLYIDTDLQEINDEDSPRRVNVIIHPYYLRVDLLNIGSNILPVPRSADPPFYENVPTAILITNPVFSLLNDHNFGTAIGLQTKTDLLNLPQRIFSEKGAQPTKLDIIFNGQFSIGKPYYNFNLGLSYGRPEYSGSSTAWNLSASYINSRLPLGNSQYKLEDGQISNIFQGRLMNNLLDFYLLGQTLSYQQSDYTQFNESKLKHSKIGLGVYSIIDGRLSEGFSRVAAWFDAGFNDWGITKFQRFAGRWGYASELGDTHNSFGIEVILGGGYIWGEAPEPNRFFGGNTSGNFILDPFSSMQIKEFPVGPIIRSFGRAEAGLINDKGLIVGGNYYWHFNFNLAIPLPWLAYPLIPDIVITETPRHVTLRSALIGQVESAKDAIINDLVEKRGYPDDDQTEAIAGNIIDKDIRPTINYLANRANVFSVKPLLLFDIVQMGRNKQTDVKTWFAAGFGLQVNVVNAKLELAYARTIALKAESSSGNFSLRFNLQNFF